MNQESVTAEGTIPTKPMHFGVALVLSFLIFNVGQIISQTIRWTDHLDGLRNGLFHILIYGFGWCFWFLPWSLIVYCIYRKRENKRLRAQWILAPAWLVLILMLGGLVLDPPNAKKRFERLALVDFPHQVQDLNTKFSGGGLADYGDTYYFKTSSAEIERIIRELKMTEDESWDTATSHTIIKPLSGSPDFRKWQGARQYKCFDGRMHWFKYLITDATKTQAYIFVGCT